MVLEGHSVWIAYFLSMFIHWFIAYFAFYCFWPIFHSLVHILLKTLWNLNIWNNVVYVGPKAKIDRKTYEICEPQQSLFSEYNLIFL